jgi:hypothetical protein
MGSVRPNFYVQNFSPFCVFVSGYPFLQDGNAHKHKAAFYLTYNSSPYVSTQPSPPKPYAHNTKQVHNIKAICLMDVARVVTPCASL